MTTQNLEQTGTRTAIPCKCTTDAPSISELTGQIPPVDDISAMLSGEGAALRFRYGDGGESLMTGHLWSRILKMGLDDDTRKAVVKAGVAPPSLAGPFSVKAGLQLVQGGAFAAVAVQSRTLPVRWICGTLLEGGHCHRMVARDVDLEAGDSPTVVHCFACEGGRGESLDRQLRVVSDAIAPPSIRGLATQSGQFDLWSAIASFCMRFAPGCRSLPDAMRGDALEGIVQEERDSWRTAFEADEGHGVVLVMDGLPVAADLFDAPADFERFGPGLLRSYMLEAMLRNDAHSTDGMEIVSAGSEAGKTALRQLFTDRERRGTNTAWHTFLLAGQRPSRV